MTNWISHSNITDSTCCSKARGQERVRKKGRARETRTDRGCVRVYVETQREEARGWEKGRESRKKIERERDRRERERERDRKRNRERERHTCRADTAKARARVAGRVAGVYTYKYIWTCTYIFTCVCICIYMYTCAACVCSCVRFVQAYTHTNAYAFAFAFAFVSACVNCVFYTPAIRSALTEVTARMEVAWFLLSDCLWVYDQVGLRSVNQSYQCHAAAWLWQYCQK